MKLTSRRGPALLAILYLAGCTYWQARPIAPREALADPGIDRVRLTRTTGETIEGRVAELRGDSIYGTRGGGGPLTCERASDSCTLQLPISEVGFVEVRSFSVMRTVAVVLVPVGALFVIVSGGGY